MGLVRTRYFMTYRILNFPDMTTEGSFPLGGGLCNCHYNRGFTIYSDSFRGRSRNACRFSDWFTVYKGKIQLF